MTTSNHRTFLSFFCVCIITILLYCSSRSVTGGASGSEVSACTGTVVDLDGEPIENALVRLRPVSFLPDSGKSESYLETHSVFDTITGRDGVYGFFKLVPDSYSIEVIYNDTVTQDTLGSYTNLHIGYDETLQEIPPLAMSPLANVSGKVTIEYSEYASIFVQSFGLDRYATIDSDGNFSIRMPRGAHRLHIAAYQVDATDRLQELDGMDLSFNVVPGEQRDAGSISLRPPPPLPCKDGSCDLAIVRILLDATGNTAVSLDNIVTTNSRGRVIALNLRNLDLSVGIPDDITQLIELRHLDLSNTGLTSLFHHIDRMMYLETLELGGNQLEMISLSIGALRRLRELDLSGNKLSMLPSSIMHCDNLSNITVSQNRLCTLPPDITQWLDSRSSDWRDSQQCQQ